MTKYFTADWHFSHARIIELTGRPFDSVAKMDETMIANINDTVQTDDELYVLGDIALGKLDESLGNLELINCLNVYLYPGNHDRFSLAYQRKGDRVAKVKEAREKYAARIHGQVFTERLNRRSVWAAPLDVTKRPLLMSHYPYVGDSHGEDRHADMRPTDNGNPLLHGHVHEEWKFRGDNMFNVGVDVNDFRPVSEDEVMDWYKSL